MRYFGPRSCQTQQIFSALILTSILSLGAGTTFINAAAADSTGSLQSTVGLKQFQQRELPRSVINAIRNNIARTYRIPPGQLRVVSYSQQNWSDSCLGLGQPAETCLRISIENGWRVVMSDGRRTWSYRSDSTGRTVRSEAQENPNSSNLPNSVANAVLNAASGQLGVSTSQLQITSSQQQTWPDRCLGLPSPVELCASARTPGWRVTVEGRQQRLVYHTDRTGSLIRLNKSASSIGDASLPQSVSDAVLRAASQRTSLSTSELRIVKFEQLTTDGCLGLPRPGEACTKIALQAWEATVEGGQQRLVYRADSNGSQVRLNEAASRINDANVPQSIGNAVLQFASRQLGVSSSQLRIIKAQQQTWSDSCLGLPRPTERCMGTPTPGWRVFVQSKQLVYVYRTDDTGSRIRAEDIDRQQPSDRNLPDSVAKGVLQDASRRLNLSTSRLRIVRTEQRDWPNGCLGLVEPGRLCTNAVISGWRVTVEGGGQTYVYRTDESGSLIKLEGAADRGNSGAVQIPSSELPPPLSRSVIFRAITSGGLIGRTYETTLLDNGRMIRTPITSSITVPTTEVIYVSPNKLQQFKQLLARQPLAQFNGLSYPAPSGSADYITVTVSSRDGTVRYSDIAQNRLPDTLQELIQAWNDIARTR